MENLKITIVQPDIVWENVQANLEKYSEMISDLESTDVIVLPEMFNTGFSLLTGDSARAAGAQGLEFLKNSAREYNIILCGSLPELPGACCYHSRVGRKRRAVFCIPCAWGWSAAGSAV